MSVTRVISVIRIMSVMCDTSVISAIRLPKKCSTMLQHGFA